MCFFPRVPVRNNSPPPYTLLTPPKLLRTRSLLYFLQRYSRSTVLVPLHTLLCSFTLPIAASQHFAASQHGIGSMTARVGSTSSPSRITGLGIAARVGSTGSPESQQRRADGQVVCPAARHPGRRPVPQVLIGTCMQLASQVNHRGRVVQRPLEPQPCARGMERPRSSSALACRALWHRLWRALLWALSLETWPPYTYLRPSHQDTGTCACTA